MVQQYESDFDAELMGQSGPPYWSFGRGRPPIGLYIEGYVVDKKSRHATKFQTEKQRERGDQREYQYFVNKKLVTSTKSLEQYLQEEPTARPVKDFILTLQTQLRDPEKGDKDDGRRQFTLPRDAKGKLADALRNQGMEGGLPLGAFVRITLTELEELEGLDTPKRHYKVEVWDAGEQPSAGPAQPVDPRAQQKAPAQQQQQYQFPNQGAPAQQPQFAGAQAGAAPQFAQGGAVQGQAIAQQQAAQFPQYPDNVLAMMKQQGLACPPGNEDRW